MHNSSKKLFCAQPFKHLAISTYPKRGDAYLCCQAWLPVSIGNVLDTPVADVWNSDTAQEIRRSILDGSFRHCSKECPWLQTESVHVQTSESVTDEKMAAVINRGLEILDEGPTFLNASFDLSCNLACPSCRREHIIESWSSDDILRLQKLLADGAFQNLDMLNITGSGDAFGSPYFMRWLRTMDVAKYPKLHIHVHTNAQLWTPAIWAKIPLSVRERITATEISIDAAREHTYALNRRGGKWQKLISNLEFISYLRSNGPLRFMKVSMVVQDNNFEEMPEFVELGKKYNADGIYFSHLTNWGTFNDEELRQRSVHISTHPNHQKLIAVLNNPALRDERVNIGNLTAIAK